MAIILNMCLPRGDKTKPLHHHNTTTTLSPRHNYFTITVTSQPQAELKRVYTQLQVYKTKSLRLDNPHISRKKGGKKQVHRRFSLQTFHNKHKRQATASETATAEAEASKTPEESTNSAERGSVCMEDGELSNRKSSFKRHQSKSKV